MQLFLPSAILNVPTLMVLAAPKVSVPVAELWLEAVLAFHVPTVITLVCANLKLAALRVPVPMVSVPELSLQTKLARAERSKMVPVSAAEEPLLPMVMSPLAANVPPPVMAAEVT